MWRNLLLFSLVMLVTFVLPVSEAEAAAQGASEVDDGGDCADRLVGLFPDDCTPYGPGGTSARIAGIRLPDPLPELAVIPLAAPDQDAVPFLVARVVTEDAPVYAHPGEEAYGMPPKRRLGIGFVWVSVMAKTTYEGRDYYQINPDEFVSAEALRIYRPSAFQGVALAEQPQRPFAWILQRVQPSLTPGGDTNAEASPLQRYQLVQIYAEEHPAGEVWYLIGPDQWINQIYVGKVSLTPVPAGVGSDDAWVDINLFEQTLAAYVGDRMVYATLVSSGLPGWNTPVGLTQVWHKVKYGKMSGAEERPDYYFLEDVPWTLYFNQDVALHGAYWHDSFGYRHSHGCVNLAPRDARWLFDWAPETAWVHVQSGENLSTN